MREDQSRQGPASASGPGVEGAEPLFQLLERGNRIGELLLHLNVDRVGAHGDAGGLVLVAVLRVGGGERG
jgi:hypothetical protein